MIRCNFVLAIAILLAPASAFPLTSAARADRSFPATALLDQRNQQAGTAAEQRLQEKVDKLFAACDKPDTPGAALAVVRDGTVIYKRGYGIANLEYGIPIKPATIFHVASVSKQFTAFAITLLAQQGKLRFDDDLRKYLPEVPDFGKTITINHLLHHTSGLRDQWELLAMAGWRLDDVITREHILKMVRHEKELNFDPGQEMLYCNTGYTLLGVIVERVSGQSFRQFTQENIFKPLDMTNTHFHDDHEMIVKNRAYSYSTAKTGGFKLSALNYANAGATSLFTTVEDLAKWIHNFDDAKVGGRAVIDQMLQTGVLNSGEKINYALGLVVGEHKGLKMVSHSGGDAGYRSHVVWFPAQKFGVVVLSNFANLSPQRLAEQVADAYLAGEETATPEKPASTAAAPAPAPVKIDPAMYDACGEGKRVNPPATALPQLGEYAGTYYSDELGTTYTLAVQEEKLVAQHRRLDDITLTPLDRDMFLGNQWFFQRIRFTRDKDGRVTGMRVSGARVRNMRFDRHPQAEPERSPDSRRGYSGGRPGGSDVGCT